MAGKVDRASPFSSRRDCGAAGIASLLVAKTQIPITGREASFGLQMLRIAPEQQDIAPPLPGTQAQVRGKSSLHAFSKFPDKSLEIIIIIIKNK